jgi:hypothetical protein
MKYYLNRKQYMSELAEILSTSLFKVNMEPFLLWFYTIKRYTWNVGLRDSVIYSKLIKAIARKLEVRNELYEKWVNLSHGMELQPNINTGHRNNENGILYQAEYVMQLHKNADLNTQDKLVFESIVNALRHQDSGVYNRGAGESTPEHEYYVAPENRRTISHDNISAISCGSHLLGNYDECAKIAKHGIKNFFVYNNIKPLRRLPVNPGNISPWLALGGYTKLALVFLPFFIANFLITMSKPAQDTSGKKLYLLKLYSLRNTFGFKTLYKLMNWKLQKQYGDNYINKIYTIYYPEGHPLREITK